MFEKKLREKIKEVKSSIVAIGFKPSSDKITIIGSGFAVSNDGKILSAAHLYNQLKPDQKDTLMAMAMTKQSEDNLEHYGWFPIKIVEAKKDDANDLILFQLDDYKKTLLKKLELGNSDAVEAGDESYFIGFPYAGQLINDGFGITLIVNKTIISNIKRDGIDPSHKRNFIILDAISNPGNSGCPLMDLNTNRVVGVMTIAFRMQSQVNKELDIREPMHICAARPINLAKSLI